MNTAVSMSVAQINSSIAMALSFLDLPGGLFVSHVNWEAQSPCRRNVGDLIIHTRWKKQGKKRNSGYEVGKD